MDPENNNRMGWSKRPRLMAMFCEYYHIVCEMWKRDGECQFIGSGG